MPCNAPNPGPDGGFCPWDDHDGPHSFEPRVPDRLPSADVVRMASDMSVAVELPPEEMPVSEPLAVESAPEPAAPAPARRRRK